MPRSALARIVAPYLLISALPLAAQESTAENPQVVIARSLERIADSLERLERSQGQEVWLRRTEIAAIRQRELDRRLSDVRDRIAGLNSERQTLVGSLKRLEDLESDPDYPSDQLDIERGMVQDRLQVVAGALREANDRRSELEVHLNEAERELEGRLDDLDRQLRAP